MIKVLPCPRCGTSDYYHLWQGYWDHKRETAVVKHSIECTKCHYRTRDFIMQPRTPPRRRGTRRRKKVINPCPECGCDEVKIVCKVIPREQRADDLDRIVYDKQTSEFYKLECKKCSYRPKNAEWAKDIETAMEIWNKGEDKNERNTNAANR